MLGAPEAHRGSVSAGAGFVPIATEMDGVMRAGMSRISGPAEAVAVARRMMPAMRASLDDQWDAAQQAEPSIIVSHPKALGGLHIAERLGIPAVASLPLPFLTPTTDFPIPFVARSLPRRVNRLTYQFNRFTAMAYGGMINTFRARLGLERMSRFSDYLHTAAGERLPVLYPFSRHVVPVPRDYPPSAHVTGYWFRDGAASSWSPPAELADFLAQDGPVVYAGFGSMGFGRGAVRRGEVVLAAVRRAGVRAVVATGWGGLAAESADDVLVIDDVPHAWLFPRVDALVHHGGAGTTAAGLRAGKPALICPVLGDQPFWARRVHELGAGPRPLPLRRASADVLGERIRELVGTPAYAEAAQEIGSDIAEEDGTGVAVEALRRIESRAITG